MKTQDLQMLNKVDCGTNPDEGFEYDKAINIFDKCESKRNKDPQTVIFTAIEFPWIFKGPSALSFIAYLTDVEEGSKIFTVQTIQDIIIFQWRYFKKSYIQYKLTPFALYFILLLIFSSVNYVSNVNENLNDRYSERWDISHDVIGALILALAFYFILLEIFKIVKKNVNFSNLLDWAFHSSVAILVIMKYLNVSETTFRIFAVFVIIQAYQQLFFHLRVFDSTAVLITMVYYIVQEMLVFSAIFLISILCFANCFYVVQGLQEPNEDVTPLVGNFIMSFLYTYAGALGNFSTDNFDSLGQNSWILWFLFYISSFIITIVFLNLLIAIMGDTYDTVMMIQKEERFRAKCRLIYENEFIFNRDRLFANSRYIIVANIDKITNQSDDDWEGKINALKSSFSKQLEAEHEKTTDNFKSLRIQNQQLSDLVKQQDNKMIEINSQLFKISSQIQLMEGRKRVKTIIKRQGNKIKEFLETQFQKTQKMMLIKDEEEKKSKTETPLLINPLVKFLKQKSDLNT
ncbi:UNKNOWN [Stylonychia lemnae]|uniref:Wd-40 repeat protein n=1 Tax=Stylonychia lemnae TaxID=5949 RepID=A0A078A3A0_STYLE|nr:UNKNOWN [Stylonychia lemnae]|eukprot:CDW75983.1 UNKNOWN [Stylonychia lemnae]